VHDQYLGEVEVQVDEVEVKNWGVWDNQACDVALALALPCKKDHQAGDRNWDSDLQTSIRGVVVQKDLGTEFGAWVVDVVGMRSRR